MRRVSNAAHVHRMREFMYQRHGQHERPTQFLLVRRPRGGMWMQDPDEARRDIDQGVCPVEAEMREQMGGIGELVGGVM